MFAKTPYNEYTISRNDYGTILDALERLGLSLRWSTDRRARGERSCDASRNVREPAEALVSQADTYRYSGHHVEDINREYYRSKQGRAALKTERDFKLHANCRWAGNANAAALDQDCAAGRTDGSRSQVLPPPNPSVDQVDEDVRPNLFMSERELISQAVRARVEEMRATRGFAFSAKRPRRNALQGASDPSRNRAERRRYTDFGSRFYRRWRGCGHGWSSPRGRHHVRRL